ncbi:YtxH domain-containing protein [Ornithinibacillus scapharcae]|uniref:YtxH domain-containing protein n=1 Tax=Ornithinibacillus scapharcae TaxID=1147159 RepID=UPI000225ADE1|nr:YtxH domain-containing protein [Ornithinibacillus scapharcae]
MSDNSGKNFVVGTIIGAAVGASLALLFAPKSGKEMRKDINQGAIQVKDRASEWKDIAQTKGLEWKDIAQAKGQEWMDMASEKGTELKQKTQELTSNVQSKIQDMRSNGTKDSAQQSVTNQDVSVEDQ